MTAAGAAVLAQLGRDVSTLPGFPQGWKQLSAVDLQDPATGGRLLDCLGPGWDAHHYTARTWVVTADGHEGPCEPGSTLGEACCRAALKLGRWPGGAS